MLQAKIINIARTIQQKAARSKKWEKNGEEYHEI